MARNRLDLDLISSVDFGSDRSDLILRAGRRRLTPVTSSATALTGNSPDFTNSAAMRVWAVSEGRGDTQRARRRTGRSGERALGCERVLGAGPGKRGRGEGLLGRAAGWFGPSAGEEGVGRCGRERRERTGLGSWAAGLDAGLFSWVGLGC